MSQVPISPLEVWRKRTGRTQAQVAKAIYSSDQLISRAERHLPIGKKFVDRLVALSEGVLKPGDFRITNGGKAEGHGKTRHTKAGGKKKTRRKHTRPK